MWPFITQVSPSRTALVSNKVGSEPAVSGSVMENPERNSPANSGSIQRFFCSSLPPMASSSALPESGALLPKMAGAIDDRPSISCINPSFT